MKEKTLDEEYYEAISGIPDKIMGIKEKTLSDKIRDINEHETPEQQSILVKDIKQSIKRLKKASFWNSCKCKSCKDRQWVITIEDIDKIFGDKLI